MTPVKQALPKSKVPDVFSGIWARRGKAMIAADDAARIARTATARAFGAEPIPRKPWWTS